MKRPDRMSRAGVSSFAARARRLSSLLLEERCPINLYVAVPPSRHQQPRNMGGVRAEFIGGAPQRENEARSRPVSFSDNSRMYAQALSRTAADYNAATTLCMLNCPEILFICPFMFGHRWRDFRRCERGRESGADGTRARFS